jgi:hypothetical protein
VYEMVNEKKVTVGSKKKVTVGSKKVVAVGSKKKVVAVGSKKEVVAVGSKKEVVAVGSKKVVAAVGSKKVAAKGEETMGKNDVKVVKEVYGEKVKPLDAFSAMMTLMKCTRKKCEKESEKLDENAKRMGAAMKALNEKKSGTQSDMNKKYGRIMKANYKSKESQDYFKCAFEDACRKHAVNHMRSIVVVYENKVKKYNLSEDVVVLRTLEDAMKKPMNAEVYAKLRTMLLLKVTDEVMK